MTLFLSDLETPCLLLDKAKMDANHDRMQANAIKRGVTLRPHLKTVKSIEAARYVLKGTECPIAVSTLKEVEEFGRAGFKDILYAVAITPQKLDRVLAIRAEGIDLKILIDSEEMADAVAQKATQSGQPLPVFIEVDVDGHRAGIPEGQEERLIDIAQRLTNGRASLYGVLAHAGESYDLSEADAICQSALAESKITLHMAQALKDAGFDCPHISIGSTPTALADIDDQGVTELRAGVYVFFDLVQTGIGVCTVDDIAISVLTTVNGWHDNKKQIFIDAGWMALSRDRGTSSQKTDQYFGLVCDEQGKLIPDLVVLATNQEHGIVTLRPGVEGETPRLPIGTRLRILPNHACATGSQYSEYNVLGHDGSISDVWLRFKGW